MLNIHIQRKERGVNNQTEVEIVIAQGNDSLILSSNFTTSVIVQSNNTDDEDQLCGFPKARRLMQADSIQPKLYTEVERLLATDLRTSKTYVYLSGNHTNSSTR